jgi:peptidoglycan/LPS O-acetylase OafA/YrhL
VAEVDSLRLIAALMVVAFHWTFRGGVTHEFTSFTYPPLMAYAQYGYMGVDLFFIVSGFVILMTAQGKTVYQFAVSRVLRLYPAFWICCSITAAAEWLFHDPHFATSVPTYLWNMTLATNFLPFQVPSVDGVYWSLFCEIRFYILVALVVLIGWLGRLEALLWAWLAAAAVLQVFPHPARLVPWLQVEYAGLFAAGACFFLIRQQGLTRRRFALLSASFVLAAWHTWREVRLQAQAYHGHPSAFVALGLLSVFFVVMLVISTRGMAALRWRHSFIAGAITYPLYLLHQNLGYMTFNKLADAMPAGALLAGMLAAVLFASWIVCQHVEPAVRRPMRSLLSPGKRPVALDPAKAP